HNEDNENMKIQSKFEALYLEKRREKRLSECISREIGKSRAPVDGKCTQRLESMVYDKKSSKILTGSSVGLGNEYDSVMVNVTFRLEPILMNFNRDGRFGKGEIGRGRCGGNRVICQIFNVANHIADKCWYMNDSSYPTSTANQSSQQGYMQRDPNLNLAQFRSNNTCDNELANLNMGSEYSGSNRLQMGNGGEISINHIGNSFLKSPQNSKTFLLRNLLHVPSITKNLLSVSSFSLTTMYSLNPSYCLVKDQTTKDILLKGNVRDGLYHFSLQRTKVFGDHQKAPQSLNQQ
ncbi:Unknown protein, partial [Striga hermonthica]